LTLRKKKVRKITRFSLVIWRHLLVTKTPHERNPNGADFAP